MRTDEQMDFYERITQHLSAVGSDVKGLRAVVEEHIRRDEEWKHNAMPAIEAWSNLKGFGKVGAILAGGIITAATVIGVFYGLITWIRGGR